MIEIQQPSSLALGLVRLPGRSHQARVQFLPIMKRRRTGHYLEGVGQSVPGGEAVGWVRGESAPVSRGRPCSWPTTRRLLALLGLPAAAAGKLGEKIAGSAGNGRP